MSTNVKVTRFVFIMSLIFAILTYAVSLNISYEWFDIDWLSNNFLITIFGGTFASMLVVLICEIQRYFLNKREAENDIFKQLSALYINLSTIKFNVEKQIENKDEEVPKELVKFSFENVESTINILKSIDYATFDSKDTVCKMFNEFLSKLVRINVDFTYVNLGLPYSINNDQINNLKNYRESRPITSSSPETSRALNLCLKKVDPVIDEIDRVVQMLDDNCSNRYHWKLFKSATESITYKSDNVLENFLKQG